MGRGGAGRASLLCISLSIFTDNDMGFRYEFHVLDNAFLVHATGVKTLEERDRGKKPAKAKNKDIWALGWVVNNESCRFAFFLLEMGDFL